MNLLKTKVSAFILPYVLILIPSVALVVFYIQGFISDEARNGWDYYPEEHIAESFGSVLIPISAALLSLYISSLFRVRNFSDRLIAIFTGLVAYLVIFRVLFFGLTYMAPYANDIGFVIFGVGFFVLTILTLLIANCTRPSMPTLPITSKN